MFIAGRVLQGLCTSLLLIAAVPPLALGYPVAKLKTTAMIMNMVIFGAVAAGPAIGGLQAAGRRLASALLDRRRRSPLTALVLAILTFEDAPPADPDSPRDPLALGMAAVGCVAAFFGASQLTSHAFLDPIAIVPLVGGLAVIVVADRLPGDRAKQPAADDPRRCSPRRSRSRASSWPCSPPRPRSRRRR